MLNSQKKLIYNLAVIGKLNERSNMIDLGVHNYAQEHDLVKFSAIPHLETVTDLLRSLKITNAVDIGTFRGISASFLAQFAENVYTFDAIDYPEKYKVWNDLGINDRIHFYLIKSRRTDYPYYENAKDAKPIIDSLQFDFAFIDGFHDYDNVKGDFEMVKKCGKVLFHDIIPFYPGVVKFTQEIGITKLHRFLGYWEKNS